MKLSIHASDRFPEVLEADLPWTVFLAELVAEIGPPSDAVELSFVSDGEIRALNAQWRDKDVPTDVLSFSYGRSAPGEAGDEEDPVGEIIVSVDRARAQAADLGHGVEEELSLLVIHGLFHIMGLDHEDDREAELMAEAEHPYRIRLAEYFANSSTRS